MVLTSFISVLSENTDKEHVLGSNVTQNLVKDEHRVNFLASDWSEKNILYPLFVMQYTIQMLKLETDFVAVYLHLVHESSSTCFAPLSPDSLRKLTYPEIHVQRE